MAMLSRRVPAAAEFIRYGAASAAALAVDFGALVLLAEAAEVPYPLAAAVGFSLGLAVVYLLSVTWVFRPGRRRQDGGFELACFLAIGAGGLALNQFIIWHFTEVVGLHYQASKVVSSAAVFLFNFQLRKALLSARFELAPGVAR